MAGAIKGHWDADLFEFQPKLIGDDLGQRSGMPLSGFQASGKNGYCSIGLYSDPRSLTLAAQQLSGSADQHAVTEIRASRLDTHGDTKAQQTTLHPSLCLFLHQLLVVDQCQGFTKQFGIITAVVGLTGRGIVGELIGLDKISLPNLYTIHLEGAGNHIHHPLDGKAHKGFTDAAIRYHWTAIGQHRITFV